MSDSKEVLIDKDMKGFVEKYARDIWLAAASRHYDMTGQRVSVEKAKQLWS